MDSGGKRGARITLYLFVCGVTAYNIYNTERGFLLCLDGGAVLGFVTVLVLALLLAACGGGGSNQQSSTPSQTQSTPAASSADSGVRVIDIVFDDFSFGPQEIRVKSGERVRLNIRNNGSVAHDWYVDDLGWAPR